MAEVIEQDMKSVELAKSDMEPLGLSQLLNPFVVGPMALRFLWAYQHLIFCRGEETHGRYEFVAVESMVKATKSSSVLSS